MRKVEYWNEYSLKERLEALFDEQDFCSCLPDIFLEGEGKKEFIKQVRDTRGALVHPNTSPKRQKSSHVSTGNDELKKLTFKLMIILEICLLKRLDLNSSVIQEIIKQKTTTFFKQA